ncbi:MAG: hypothetical protein ACK58L_16895 [Planctomycetota bacterium]
MKTHFVTETTPTTVFPCFLCVWIVIGSSTTLLPTAGADEQPHPAEFCEIHVIDESTQRGVPMASLTTVDDVTYITDNAGRVALSEPELWGQTVFLRVSSPGYQCPKDGFGIEGVRLILRPQAIHEIRLKRLQLAERLYRITGRDLYRDSVHLGYQAPIQIASMAGGVLGQDSVQPVIYGKKLFWFWGDTNRLSYPLGLFRTAGAVSPLPTDAGLSPHIGINFQYFTGRDGFARAMVDVSHPEGVVWLHGACVAVEKADEGHDRNRMVAQYSRRKSLAEPVEQGIAIWNDERELFEVATTVDLQDTWRMISDHPIVCEPDGRTASTSVAARSSDRISTSREQWLMFGNPFPMTRVRRDVASVLNRTDYESWTCREELTEEFPSEERLARSLPLRDQNGKLVWRWARQPPVTQKDEQRWIRSGLMQPAEATLSPIDADQPTRHVVMHSGTVHWNAHRRKWILIAIEHAWDKSSPSFLGEVFYSESDTPQGPFMKALKIATHPGQSFYNPCHHPFFDQDGGRTIFFEGTYCNTFTQSPATPRYNYNQLMYRLQLDATRITETFGPAGSASAEN